MKISASELGLTKFCCYQLRANREQANTRISSANLSDIYSNQKFTPAGVQTSTTISPLNNLALDNGNNTIHSLKVHSLRSAFYLSLHFTILRYSIAKIARLDDAFSEVFEREASPVKAGSITAAWKG